MSKRKKRPTRREKIANGGPKQMSAYERKLFRRRHRDNHRKDLNQ